MESRLPSANALTVYPLGVVEYADGLALQDAYTAARREGLVGDSLLLLQHPPVLTLGRAARAANVLESSAGLAAKGVEVFHADRGGDVTYHGPGQLVGYPLLHLPPGRQDVRWYVRALERVVVRTLLDFGICAEGDARRPGVWVQNSRLGGTRKIAALGVHLSRWNTRHGFALNVAPDLTHFNLIVPCGIADAGVTSMAAEVGAEIDFEHVRSRAIVHFGNVFEVPTILARSPRGSVAVVIHDGTRALMLRRTPERGGFWQPVTGTISNGEATEATAMRELGEETKLRGTLKRLGEPRDFLWPSSVLHPEVGRQMPFGVRVATDAVPQLSDEHDGWEWMLRDTAVAATPHPSLKRAIREALG